MSAASCEILWADDERFHLQGFICMLEMREFTVRRAYTVKEAKETIAAKPPALVIIDVMMPSGEPDDDVETHGGFRSGVALAKWIAQNHPTVPFLGCSAVPDPEVVGFFRTYGAGFIGKRLPPDELLHAIQRAISKDRLPVAETMNVFIVHGHDEIAKLELKNYVQNVLGFPEPIILHERPSLGRTIIEKFEDEAGRATVVFVLMTPDDKAGVAKDGNNKRRRARQNVIFEMGYFVGVLGRKSGRVLLLHKGPLELPSDLNGVVYIDISNGIAAAGEDIRKELQQIIEA